VSAATALGLMAALLNAGIVAPQAWRSLRTRDNGGVDRDSYVATALSALTWVVYGYLRHDPVLMASTSATALWSIAVVVALLDGRQIRLGRLPRTLLLAAGVSTLVSTELLGTVAAAGTLCAFGSVGRAVLRQKRLTGVAPQMWLLGLVASVCWVAHGVFVGLPALVVGDGIFGALSAVVLIRLFWPGELRPHPTRRTNTARPTSRASVA
jgi:uncharacterized protein with PQ loop repeat